MEPNANVHGPKITNVHAKCNHHELVMGRIDKKVFDYFFRHVLTGDRGARQAMVCWFFQKLYDECQSAGIQSRWDDTNEARIAKILNRLNFRSVSAGRTDTSPARHTKKSKAGQHDAGRTDAASPSTSGAGDQPSNPQRENQ